MMERRMYHRDLHTRASLRAALERLQERAERHRQGRRPRVDRVGVRDLREQAQADREAFESLMRYLGRLTNGHGRHRLLGGAL